MDKLARSLRDAQAKVEDHDGAVAKMATRWLDMLPLLKKTMRSHYVHDSAFGTDWLCWRTSLAPACTACTSASVPHIIFIFIYHLICFYLFISGLETGERERAEWNAESRLNARVELLESEAIAVRRSMEVELLYVFTDSFPSIHFFKNE